MKAVKKVKIVCHCCDGNKTIEEERYPDGKTVLVSCPECGGGGYVYAYLSEAKA